MIVEWVLRFIVCNLIMLCMLQETIISRGTSLLIASFASGGFLLPLPYAGTLNAATYLTENVVIVFVGGIRNTEAFDDTAHQFIPRIWQNIRPHGVLYRNFYNMARPGMGTATFSALMGVRRDENHRGGPWHGLSPGLFEYYRKDRSVPMEEVWAVLSNDFDGYGVNYSLHPGYGSQYAASLWGNPRNNDPETFEKAMRVLDEYHPSLLTVHFRNPDRKAQHTYDPDLPDSIAWRDYTHAVTLVDSLTNLLWEWLQADPVYSGKTTLFISGEHGRHLPAYGDFEWHGDACEGCRRLPFLAVGPDFKAGETIELRGDLIDLCPTIGELLSFEPVFAEGRVLWEAFAGSPEHRNPHRRSVSKLGRTLAQPTERILSTPGAYAHSPFVAMKGDTIYAVWSQRDTTQVLESWEVVSARSTDAGVSWTEPAALFSSSDPATEVVTVGGLAGDSKTIGVMAASYAREEYWEGDSAWCWRGDLKITEDGDTWQLRLIDDNRFIRIVSIDNIPALAINGTWCGSALLVGNYDRYFAFSLDLGEDWFRSIEDYQPGSAFSSPDRPALLIDENIYYIESMRDLEESDLIFFSRGFGDGGWQRVSIVDDVPGESFFPQIASSDSIVYCVWSDNRNGHFEVYFSRSTDAGASWSPNVKLSTSGVNTWMTAIEAGSDTLLVVWEDYRDGESSLYKKVSFDGGLHWSEDYPEVTEAGFSTSPKLSHSGSHYYMVWQDDRSGEWGIYFKEVDIDLPVSVEEGGPLEDGGMPRVAALSQNFPNPFNPFTTISFDVPGREGVAADISLGVYDLRGKLVRVLARGKREPGRYRIGWDGTDGRGSPLSSGAYFYRLEIEKQTIVRKMLLVR